MTFCQIDNTTTIPVPIDSTTNTLTINATPLPRFPLPSSKTPLLTTTINIQLIELPMLYLHHWRQTTLLIKNLLVENCGMGWWCYCHILAYSSSSKLFECPFTVQVDEKFWIKGENLSFIDNLCKN